MLDIYLKNGLCFSNFKDILLYMREENLIEIEITNIEYFFEKILSEGVYSIHQIEDIVSNL